MTVTNVLKAKFQSECADCDDEIRKGDLVVKDDETGWVHDECPKNKIGKVCMECFTVKSVSGACGCFWDE